MIDPHRNLHAWTLTPGLKHMLRNLLSLIIIALHPHLATAYDDTFGSMAMPVNRHLGILTISH